eukprot:scaffold1594_cov401-Prasinococcus_capsulatus_cf.AAC.33
MPSSDRHHFLRQRGARTSDHSTDRRAHPCARPPSDGVPNVWPQGRPGDGGAISEAASVQAFDARRPLGGGCEAPAGRVARRSGGPSSARARGIMLTTARALSVASRGAGGRARGGAGATEKERPGGKPRSAHCPHCPGPARGAAPRSGRGGGWELAPRTGGGPGPRGAIFLVTVRAGRRRAGVRARPGGVVCPRPSAAPPSAPFGAPRRGPTEPWTAPPPSLAGVPDETFPRWIATACGPHPSPGRLAGLLKAQLSLFKARSRRCRGCLRPVGAEGVGKLFSNVIRSFLCDPICSWLHLIDPAARWRNPCTGVNVTHRRRHTPFLSHSCREGVTNG